MLLPQGLAGKRVPLSGRPLSLVLMQLPQTNASTVDFLQVVSFLESYSFRLRTAILFLGTSGEAVIACLEARRRDA